MARQRRQRRGWRRRAGIAALLGALSCALAPSLALAAGPLSGRTIVVDPGHGGVDSGAVAYGIAEKRLTLPIGLDLGAFLRGEGARVLLTRTSDVTVGPGGELASLVARSALANNVGADAFISIHANALDDPYYSGLMTFYGSRSGYVGGVTRSPALQGQSRLLASDVQQAVLDRTGQRNDGIHAADYYVLGHTAMPSILVETGFVTNAAEAQRLTSPGFQEAIAGGIARGVEAFFGGGAATVPLRDASRSYTVRPGDTLSGIALRFGLSQQALVQLNGLRDRDAIRAGQTLLLAAGPATMGDASFASAHSRQGPARYVVQRGDTLSGIAMRFDISEGSLRRLNGLDDPNRVRAGQTLRLR